MTHPNSLTSVLLILSFLSPFAYAQKPTQQVTEMLDAASVRSTSRIEIAKKQLQRWKNPAPLDQMAADRLVVEAAAAFKAGDNELMLRLLTQAHAADPGSAAVAAALAFSQLRLNLFDDAITTAKLALTLNPEYWTAWLNLGHALARTGVDTQAAASYYLAVRFSNSAATVQAILQKQTTDANPSVANAAKLALSNLALDGRVRTLATRHTQSGSLKAAAPDIAGIKSLIKNESQILTFSRSSSSAPEYYKKGLEKYKMATFWGDQPAYLRNATVNLIDASYAGEADAPGLLGVIISLGYDDNGARAKNPPDLAEARILFDLSTKRGGSMGYLGAGDLAMDGNGEPKNPAKAIELYEKAARVNNEVAQRRLVLLSLKPGDAELVKRAKAAIVRAGIPDHVVNNIKVDYSSRDTGFKQTICTMIEDQLAIAQRNGDRNGITSAKFRAERTGCKL